MATELMKQEGGPLATVQPTAMEIIARAVQDGRPAAELTELLQFAREVRKDEAERAFNAAFASFKAACPAIVRRTKDEYITVNRNGMRQARMYASLYDISAAVDGPLQKNGLTYDWADAVLTEDGCIVRRFVLRHEAGHSRSTSSPPIPIEGGKAYKDLDKDRKGTSASPQQRMGVADTYAMRYSMISGLGMTTCDEDTDGHSGRHEEIISEDDYRSLNDALIQVHADVPAFLGMFKIAKLSEMPASRLDEAWSKIEAKRKKLGASK